MKGIMIGVLVLALVYVSMAALLFVMQRHVIFPRHLVPHDAHEYSVDGFDRIQLLTGDGVVLDAYWRPPAKDAPVIVAFHGNADAPFTHANRFSGEKWARYGVLAIAFRGYPGSGGEPGEAGLIEDGEAAVAHVADMAPGSPLVLYGHSLGAAVAVAMAERHEAMALVLEAPFESMLAMARRTAPWAPAFLLKDTFRSDLRIAGSRACRTLVLHGNRDTVIPVAFGRALASAAGADFVEVEGAGHNDIVGAADERILALLEGGNACSGHAPKD